MLQPDRQHEMSLADHLAARHDNFQDNVVVDGVYCCDTQKIISFSTPSRRRQSLRNYSQEPITRPVQHNQQQQNIAG